MNELLASFVQTIPADGYRLRMLERVLLEEPHTPGTGAQALCWPAEGERGRSYEPLIEEESLFYRFADLGAHPDAEAILAFANRYGWMGIGGPAVETELYADSNVDVSHQVISGEFLEDWRKELRVFVPVHDMWHAVSGNVDASLRGSISWDETLSSVSYSDDYGSAMVIASSSFNVELFNTLVPGDLVAPAKVMLARIINQQLSQHCSPALLFKGVSYQESLLYFRCNNLLGVIWLQFARAVANKSEHRRCVECASPFLPSRTERGKKKQFCTDACKSRNYRNKVQKLRH